jgi:starvation-inducible DNA-binding protein
MFDTRNDLPAETRQAIVDILNVQLADAIDLERQAKQAHWNVKGPNFVGLHELFDRIAAQGGEHVDDIAERAVALGGVARGTIQSVAKRSSLPEYPLEAADWRTHVRSMQHALAAFGRGVRRRIDEAAALGDADTADLFTGISRAVDKSLWMVEAHLQDVAAHVERA